MKLIFFIYKVPNQKQKLVAGCIRPKFHENDQSLPPYNTASDYILSGISMLLILTSKILVFHENTSIFRYFILVSKCIDCFSSI